MNIHSMNCAFKILNPVGACVVSCTRPGETKVCRYNWHSAGSLGWTFLMLKYKYIFQMKYAEAILSNILGNCYGLKLAKVMTAVKKINLLRYYNFRHTFVQRRETVASKAVK